MTDLFAPKRDEAITAGDVSTRDFSKFLEDLVNVVNFLQIGDGDPIGSLETSRKGIFLRQDGGVNTTLYINELGDGTSDGWRAI